MNFVILRALQFSKYFQKLKQNNQDRGEKNWKQKISSPCIFNPDEISFPNISNNKPPKPVNVEHGELI